MKKILSLTAFAFLLVSCDKVPVGDRVKNPGNGGGNVTTYQQKAVLIEEFTGITCNNCPKAAAEIKLLEAAYPGRVHTIGIHASNFALPQPPDYPDDFRTTVGTFIYEYANPFGVPSGLIDRTNYGGATFAKPFQNFASVTADILLKDTADIRIDAVSNADTLNLSASILVDIINQKNLTNAPDLYWMAVLTESNIKAPQKLPDNSKDKDYKHSHVLRASYNGNFGTQLGSHSMAANDTSSVSANLTLDPSWVASNCEVVVFVYDNNTQEIIQTVTVEL
jgi:hypothetical protein